MTRTASPKAWWAVESPSTRRALQALLGRLPRSSGLILRTGSGICPLALVPGLRFAGIEPALMLQLRDQNLIALESLVKGAVFLGVKKLFVGDPKPLSGIRPVQAMNGPAFVRAAREWTGRKMIFGVFNRASCSADLALLAKYSEAGARLAVVPAAQWAAVKDSALDLWNWVSEPDGNPFKRSRATGATVVDLLDASVPGSSPGM